MQFHHIAVFDKKKRSIFGFILYLICPYSHCNIATWASVVLSWSASIKKLPILGILLSSHVNCNWGDLTHLKVHPFPIILRIFLLSGVLGNLDSVLQFILQLCWILGTTSYVITFHLIIWIFSFISIQYWIMDLQNIYHILTIWEKMLRLYHPLWFITNLTIGLWWARQKVLAHTTLKEFRKGNRPKIFDRT